jgi:hypothetical protein
MPGRVLEVEGGYEGEDVGARSAAGIIIVAKGVIALPDTA